MTVARLGKVFDPREHALLDGCREFAQSPQTLALDDGLRVYFSTRAPDAAGGKYRSHVSFAEFEDDLTTIRRVARHQVLPLGTLGAFDEHGIFPINVLNVGSEIWGYTTGWNRRVSVSVDTAIGLVVSRDGGETFLRHHGDGPVLGPSLLEPFLVGDAFVLRVGDLFHMWYIFGQRWVRETTDSPPDRVYKIAHAVSEDGQTWVKNDGVAIIPDVLGADECQALPSVVAYNGLYHMVFCYRDVHGFRNDPARAYRLGYAVSKDLITWTRQDSVLDMKDAPGAWDADMKCYPHFCVFDGTLYLFYNGNGFGREGFGLAKIDL
ncbi:MAG: hypothetical protein NXH97_23175 [Rhodobacteraceae bacterium]|nr:hypothetical protein [Paracoccaceae bacterium]